jgi:carbamoyl-phosphate synthase small subunit
MKSNRLPAILLLEDGTVFQGLQCGKHGTSGGEIAFNTAMTGYQEVFTDPSYHGQLVVMASVHMGNYGTMLSESESSASKVSGVIVSQFSDTASRVGDIESLQQFLMRDGIVGICDIDTRRLVRHIRDNGAMNAIISSEVIDVSELKNHLDKLPKMSGRELSSEVATKETYDLGDIKGGDFVALIDFGVKENIVRCIRERGFSVRVYPMNVSAEVVINDSPNGVLFSNGPGDPSAMTESVKLIKTLSSSGIPCFGICLGHQLLGLAMGLNTEKMHHGHRGINHPVINMLTGKCEITSQNHGFVISDDNALANSDMTVTHRHLNDNTIAGIRHKSWPVFSVQFHPEAAAGPHDSRYLFDEFSVMMKAHSQSLPIQ